MVDDPEDLIRVSEAARVCGFRNKRSIIRAAAAGRIRIYRRDNWWHVSRADLQRAPLLTAGRLARLARCSTKTVRRRVKAHYLQPWVDPRRARGFRPVRRFCLADVGRLRASLRERVVFGVRLR